MEDPDKTDLTNAGLPNKQMDMTEAQKIFDTLKSSKHTQLFNTLIERAVIYSRIRVDWYNADLDKQIDLDYDRTIAHDEFISSCAMLSQKMKETGEDAKWRFAIGQDRKSIGDFACLLHAVIGIRAR